MELEIGFGTFRLVDANDIKRCINYAITECNYRLIDTAAVYRNEQIIGQVVKECISAGTIRRSDIFVMSKLSPKDHGDEQHTYQACLASLERLDLDYLDLYLIHWPGKSGLKAEDYRNAEYRAASWRIMERLVDEGRFKHIGVSNYTRRHLEQLLQHARIRPYLLQIEFHPLVYNQQMIDLLEFCRQEQIIVQGYSTFGEGVLVSDAEEQLQPQDLPLIRYCRRELESIAASLRLSRAQVLLRWSIQHGVWVIPKSTSHSHIQSNIMMKSAAKLSDVDMNRMDSLLDRFSADSGVEMPKKFCWNPDSVA